MTEVDGEGYVNRCADTDCGIETWDIMLSTVAGKCLDCGYAKDVCAGEGRAPVLANVYTRVMLRVAVRVYGRLVLNSFIPGDITEC